MTSLLWFGLIALFFFLMMRGGCGAHVMGHGHQHDDQPQPAPGSDPAMTQSGPAIDPVCGMQVDPASAKSSVYRNKVYFFCSAEHRDTFEANPDKYATKGSVPATAGGQHVHG